MVERPDKHYRKQMLKQVREVQRAEARAALPLPDNQLQEMFHAIYRGIQVEGCDRSRRLTQRFLDERGLPREAVLSWLDANGGFCDCEALANAEEHWLDCRGQDKAKSPR